MRCFLIIGIFVFCINLPACSNNEKNIVKTDLNAGNNLNIDLAALEKNAKSQIKSNSISSNTNMPDYRKDSAEIKLVPKQEKTRYYLQNGIHVDMNQEKKISTSKGVINCRIPQISGLKNKELEQSLNNKMIEDAQKEIIAIASTMNADKIDEYSIYCNYETNSNNLFGFRITYNQFPRKGLLYRLTDGKRLKLGEIFTQGTDYAQLLKELSLIEIFNTKGEDECMLSRSKIDISSEQDFYISEMQNQLELYFPQKDFNVKYDETTQTTNLEELDKNVYIPLEKIDEYVNVFDMYSGSERKTHEFLEMIDRRNNIVTRNLSTAIEVGKGEVYVTYFNVRGLKDKNFENMVNSEIEKKIREVANSGLIKAYDARGKRKRWNSSGFNVYLAFNNYGYLTCKTYLSTYGHDDKFKKLRTLMSFDLIKKKKVDMKDLLTKYLNDKPDKQNVFTEKINERLKDFVVSKLAYDEIINDSDIYFMRSGELGVGVDYYGNKKDDSKDSYDAYCEFKDIISISPEEFFGN